MRDYLMFVIETDCVFSKPTNVLHQPPDGDLVLFGSTHTGVKALPEFITSDLGGDKGLSRSCSVCSSKSEWRGSGDIPPDDGDD